MDRGVLYFFVKLINFVKVIKPISKSSGNFYSMLMLFKYDKFVCKIKQNIFQCFCFTLNNSPKLHPFRNKIWGIENLVALT